MSSVNSLKVQVQNRLQLLRQVQKEVKQYRLQLLHRAVLTNLAQETPPLKMRRTWDVELKASHHPSVRLTSDTGIIQIFDRLKGKLLILGTPGSGKTTTLMGLAKVLVSRAIEDPEEPIPVLLNLSLWKDEEQAIADWVVEQLSIKYNINSKISQDWIQQLQILPLLDGLDELQISQQVRCISKINQFLSSDPPPLHLVVCSNVATYHKLPERLQLNGAIFLRPLTIPQIQDYLMNARSRELWHNIETDENLLNLAKVPLYLSMMTLAYEEILIMSWKHLQTFEEQRQYLFNAYIRRQLIQDFASSNYPKGKEPSPEKVRRWLAWLAQQLKAENLTEFSLQQIHTTWLQTPEQKQIYQQTLKLVLGIIWGIIILIIIAGLITKQLILLIVGLILGLVLSLLLEKSSLKEKIKYFVLRYTFWKTGNMPWNYQRFLNYATERLLLQKLGDRYRFVHRLLQEHFAK